MPFKNLQDIVGITFSYGVTKHKTKCQKQLQPTPSTTEEERLYQVEK